MPRPRQLSSEDVQRVLKSVNRVLQNRGIDQSVQITFASAAPGLCWRRVREVLPDGTVRFRWVQVPC
jgi:hypothetical protein